MLKATQAQMDRIFQIRRAKFQEVIRGISR
jgi:hypothetical protein